MENLKTKFRATAGAVVDEGLRQFMIKVYNYMLVALCITALTAYAVLNTPLINLFFSFTPTGQITGPSGLGWLAFFAPLILVFSFSRILYRGSLTQVIIAFSAFSALMGISLAPILLVYTGESIVRVFLITAAMFGATSIYGYTTQKDLTGMGSFLMMGVWGLIIAMIVNIFMGSSGMSYAISFIAVAVFTGLTAYDSQRIREIYMHQDSEDTLTRKAIAGALSLYINFINILIHLLRLIGDRR